MQDSLEREAKEDHVDFSGWTTINEDTIRLVLNITKALDLVNERKWRQEMKTTLITLIFVIVFVFAILKKAQDLYFIARHLAWFLFSFD